MFKIDPTLDGVGTRWLNWVGQWNLSFYEPLNGVKTFLYNHIFLKAETYSPPNFQL